MSSAPGKIYERSACLRRANRPVKAMRLQHRIVVVLLAVILAATGIAGVRNALSEIEEAVSIGQKVGTATEGLYGLLGLLAFLALATKRSWTGIPLALWAIMLVTTAAMAPIVWGGVGWMPALAAGGSMALVVALLVWGWWKALAASRPGAADGAPA